MIAKEWGIYDKRTNELISPTTFEDPDEAQIELENFYSEVYAEVRPYTELGSCEHDLDPDSCPFCHPYPERPDLIGSGDWLA